MPRTRSVLPCALLFVLAPLVTFMPPREVHASPASRWNLSVRGGYDPIDFGSERHRGAVWVAVRYKLNPWFQLMGESGFSRYRREKELSGWAVGAHYSEYRSTTDFVPLALGVRFKLFSDTESWPFVEVLPTLFRSHHEYISEDGTFQEGGTRLVAHRSVDSGSAWKPGLQVAGGIHLVTPPPGGLEFGFRGFLVKNSEDPWGIEGGGREVGTGFPSGVQRFYLFAGVSFDL